MDYNVWIDEGTQKLHIYKWGQREGGRGRSVRSEGQFNYSFV